MKNCVRIEVYLSRAPIATFWNPGDGVRVFLLYVFTTEQNMGRCSLLSEFSVPAENLFDSEFLINRSIVDAN